MTYKRNRSAGRPMGRLPQPLGKSSCSSNLKLSLADSRGDRQDRGLETHPSLTVRPPTCPPAPQKLRFLTPGGPGTLGTTDHTKATLLQGARPAPQLRAQHPSFTPTRASLLQPPTPPTLRRAPILTWFGLQTPTLLPSLSSSLASGSGYQIRVYFGKNLRRPHPRIQTSRRRGASRDLKKKKTIFLGRLSFKSQRLKYARAPPL
jgi:hypothetical protein